MVQRSGLCRVRVVSRLWRSVVATGLVASAMFALPAGAGAAAEPGCTASINGFDAYAASSPSDAVVLAEDQQVDVSGSMSSGPVTYSVEMEFAGIGWTVADGSASGNAWSDSLEVNKYSKYGVGLYKVRVVASNAAGETCRLTTYVNVDGGVLSGTAGKVGVGVLAVGGAALIGSSIAAAFGSTAGPAAGKLFRIGWK